MQLLKFELRKILLSKITILAFILLFGINIFNVAQHMVRSLPYNDYDKLQRRIEHVHAIAGEISEERMAEIEAERDAFINDPVNQMSEEEIYKLAKEDMDEFLQYAADNPDYYSEEDIAERSDISFWLMVYDRPESRMNEQAKNSLEWERITDQYRAMDDAYSQYERAAGWVDIPVEEDYNIPDNASEAVIAKWQQLHTEYMEQGEFIIDYNMGWGMFVESSHEHFAPMLGFIILIGIASLFAAEHANRTDALILSSKHGKSKVIAAKILAGFCFTFAVWLIFEVVNAIIIFSVHGLYGADSTWLNYGYAPYFITYMQAALITLGTTLLAALYLSAIVMLVSTLTKSRIASLLIGTVLIMQYTFPFLNFNDVLTDMMPGSLMSSYYGILQNFSIYDLFGVAVPSTDVRITVMITISVICIVISCIAFRRWQVKN
ncbi:MAG: ABC transporter permease [Eubacterium sp.]|nr:ABC transporter permease [Eubacterium sp.]